MRLSNIRTFQFITTIIGLVLIISSLFFGKETVFLKLNLDLGIYADWLFALFSILGNEYVLVLFLAIIFFTKRAYFVFSFLTIGLTVFTIQVLKKNPYTDSIRPYYSNHIPNKTLIHTFQSDELSSKATSNFENILDIVISDNVKPEKEHSFPSGHTGTAFTIFFIVLLICSKIWVRVLFFIYAIAVAYSRIYLAQHFPFDVGSSILIALICNLIVYKWFKKRLIFYDS